jgi:hypothetical protein
MIPTLRDSFDKLWESIGDAKDITFYRLRGNFGHHLLEAATRQFLDGLNKRYTFFGPKLMDVRGGTLLVSGSGMWWSGLDRLARNFKRIEQRFDKTIILPTTFEINHPPVLEVLMNSEATVFARENKSYEDIRKFRQVSLAHDMAFFFNYEPWKQKGSGTLVAYRTPGLAESTELGKIPVSYDISRHAKSFRDWLEIISNHKTIYTDRLHVMIAAALMGKEVIYSSSAYFKIDAVAEFLGGYNVRKGKFEG